MSLLLASLPLLLVAYALLPRAYQALLGARLLRACTRHRLIALTFDDGPGRQLTPLILDRLATAGVPATFFVLGRSVPAHLDLIAAMRADGHQIGAHGEHHVDHLRTSPWRGVFDTAIALDRLSVLLGQPDDSIAFRPPHGRLNLLSLVFVWLRGIPVAGWTHDGFDTRLGVDVPAAVTADSLRRTGGGVMLLHDFDRGIPNPSARVLARLDAILPLRHEGYRFVRFDELLHLVRTGTLPPIAPLRAPALPLAPATVAVVAGAPLAPPDAPPVPPQRRRRGSRTDA